MRRIGFFLGLALAVVAVLSWRVPTGSTALGAQARFVAMAPGELTASPAGAFLTLRPGGASAQGALRLRNIAGAPLRVSLRARPSSGSLDRELRVRIGERRAVRLGQLRAWTPAATLRAGERRRVAVRAWLPAGARERAAGALVDVTVELRAEVERE